MSRITQMEEALHIAKAVMDYCQGDAWERECTAGSRARFDTLYAYLFPVKEVVDETVIKYRYCRWCGREIPEKDWPAHSVSVKHIRNLITRL